MSPYFHKASYQLRGIICHKGSASGGHYFSIVRSSDDKWTVCDDADVKEIDIEDIPEMTFGGEDPHYDTKMSRLHNVIEMQQLSRMRHTNAFVLIYEKR